VVDSGTVKLKSGWNPTPPLPAQDSGPQGLLAGWLRYLVEQGLLQQAPTAAKKPAMLIKATNAGAQGNNIQVVIAGITLDASGDPTKTKFDLTATETDTYTGLTTATIAQSIGTDQAPVGSGLVHVVQASVHVDRTPANGAKDLPPPADFDDSGANLVFPLDVRAGMGATDPKVHVTIANADEAAKTFDLTATWSRRVTGVTTATAASALAALGYLVTVSAPPSGAFSVPTAGTFSLSGGAGTPASAILFAA